MNSSITQLANALTYKGELQIANETIANATLKIPNFHVSKYTVTNFDRIFAFSPKF